MPGVLLRCWVHQAHRGAPVAGVLLCNLGHQSLKGASWMGSYSVVQCIRHLIGQPLYCSAANAGMCGRREAMMMSPPLACDSAALPLFCGCPPFLHRYLPTTISFLTSPLIRLSAVNSSPRLGIAPQSRNSSSQLLCLPGDLCPCLGLFLSPCMAVPVWLRQGLSDSHSI